MIDEFDKDGDGTLDFEGQLLDELIVLLIIY